MARTPKTLPTIKCFKCHGYESRVSNCQKQESNFLHWVGSKKVDNVE